MSVDDMLKAVAVVSGNDAAVALAEHLAGSEEGFVEQMNQAGRRAWHGRHLFCQLHRPARGGPPDQRP